MAISKNKKPILAKFSQGNSVDSAENSKLSSWILLYYTRSYQSGTVSRQIYGLDDNFDLVLTFEANSKTKQIAENTLFLVNEYPTSLNAEGNYTVKRVVRDDNGEIVVGLRKNRGIQHINLYYYSGNELLACQVNYDSTTKKAYVDRYTTIPFEVNMNFWDFEPESKTDTENRLIITSITDVGIVDNLKMFKEISFGDDGGNQD